MTTPAKQCVPGFDVSETPPPRRVSPPERSFTPKTDNTTVTLRGVSVPLNSDVGGALITDLARNKERLFSDAQIIEKYDISETAWTEITQSKAIRLAVNAEHERRMLNGIAAQESAAKIFTEEGPQTLASILRDQRASPRHRISAAQELRHTARSGDEKPGTDTDRVIVTINLGNDEKLVVDSGPLPPKRAKEALDAETER